MLIRRPLASVFGGRKAAVLEALLGVEGDLSVRDVARIAGIPPSTASVALRSLEWAGVVTRREIGSTLAYRIDPRHFAIDGLLRIVSAARAIEADLSARVTDMLGERPLAIVLFGSVARGEDELGSDVDLLLVAKHEDQKRRWDPRVHGIAQDLGASMGRRVNMVVAVRPSARRAASSFWREIGRDGRTLAGSSVHDLVRGA